MSQRLESADEARERLARARMTEREHAELWARIEDDARQRGARRWLLPAAIAGAAVAAALALWLVPSEPAAPAAERASDPCAVDPSARTLRVAERCEAKAVQIDGDEWRLEQGAEVARVESGARVERGRVRFTVRPRKQPGDRAFIVAVSHAQIRVIGTVFTIEQRAEGGSVHVTEGTIELTWPDGAKQRVSAGESATWPRVQPAPAPEALAAPAPEAHAPDAGARRPTARAVDLDAALDRLLVLRSQKRFGEAVTLLRGTLAQKGLSETQRERLSYEIGLALEADGAPSCAHWAKHGRAFMSPRTTALVEKKLKACQRDE